MHHCASTGCAEADITARVGHKVLALAVRPNEVDRIIRECLAIGEQSEVIDCGILAYELQRCPRRTRADRMVGAGTYANQGLGVAPRRYLPVAGAGQLLHRRGRFTRSAATVFSAFGKLEPTVAWILIGTVVVRKLSGIRKSREHWPLTHRSGQRMLLS